MSSKSPRFTLSDINIGDKVFFEAIGIKNRDLYWTVVEKTDKALRVEIREMGENDSLFVYPDWILYREPRPRAKE